MGGDDFRLPAGLSRRGGEYVEVVVAGGGDGLAVTTPPCREDAPGAADQVDCRIREYAAGMSAVPRDLGRLDWKTSSESFVGKYHSVKSSGWAARLRERSAMSVTSCVASANGAPCRSEAAAAVSSQSRQV